MALHAMAKHFLNLFCLAGAPTPSFFISMFFASQRKKKQKMWLIKNIHFKVIFSFKSYFYQQKKIKGLNLISLSDLADEIDPPQI